MTNMKNNITQDMPIQAEAQQELVVKNSVAETEEPESVPEETPAEANKLSEIEQKVAEMEAKLLA